MNHSSTHPTRPPADPTRPTRVHTFERLTPPVVSIVTPFFNTGPEFRDTAVSVLQQTLVEWEWIIVDDGSTEADSVQMLDEVANLDDRIRVIKTDKNGGPSASRNVAIGEASGPYILQLDSDDQLEATAAEKMLWYLVSHPDASFVTGHTVAFGSESYVWRSGFHNGPLFLDENSASIMVMLRTEVFKDTGGYDVANKSGLEDWEFWLRCAASGHWGGTIHEPLGWYRRRADHGDRWTNWDDGESQAEFAAALKAKYGHLGKRGAFPDPISDLTLPYEPIDELLPVHNETAYQGRRMLAIFPWLTFGGADKCNLDAVRHLVATGWDVTIATTIDGDHSWEGEFGKATTDIHVLHRFLRTVDYPRYLRYLIESRKPDVVLISNSEFGYQVVPYLRAHNPDPTYVDLVHMEQPHWKSGGFGNLSNLYRDHFDLTVVISEHLKGWMAENGGDVYRVRPWHLGVDVDLWRPDEAARIAERAELAIPETRPMILYAGRLNRQKQPKVFAETIRRLAAADLDFKAVVAGDGEDREWLEAYMRQHNLTGHVRFLGAVSSDRIRKLLQAADLFFLPSEWEGIALSIYEAMAVGVPVVGADVGGQIELVTPDCGVLLPRSTPSAEAKAYAHAIAELLRDPTKRARMGANARDRVAASFSLEKMAERFDTLLAEAQRIRSDDPRPVPTIGDARAGAILAVEYTRLSDDHEAFAASVGPFASHQPAKATRPGVGARLYGILMTVLGPIYRFAKKQRFGHAVVRMRDAVRKSLGYHRVEAEHDGSRSADSYPTSRT